MNEMHKTKSAMDLLTDHLLGTIATAPNDELAKLLEESGDDVAELDQKGKAAFAAALKKHGQNKRQALHQQSIHRTAQRSRRAMQEVPTARPELLAMLEELTARGAAMGKPVSLHHRDLTDMPDEELRSFVMQLIDLQTTDLPKE